MDQFNKALSFILGLVVVAVFIVVASGKFKFGNLKLPNAKTSAKVSITPTVSPTPSKKSVKPTVTPISTMKVASNGKITVLTAGKAQLLTPTPAYNETYHSYSGKGVPAAIPSTGVPIVLFPLMGSGLVTGLFLKSKGKE